MIWEDLWSATMGGAGGLLGKLFDRVDLEWGWCCGVVGFRHRGQGRMNL